MIEGISGVHCKVYVSKGSVFLADLNSTNGTFLKDGKRLTPGETVWLQSGRQFYLGNEKNMFQIEAVQDIQPVRQPEKAAHSFTLPHEKPAR